MFSLSFICYIYLAWVFISMSMSAEVKGQLPGTGSLLLYGPWELNSGHQAWQSARWPAEPSSGLLSLSPPQCGRAAGCAGYLQSGRRCNRPQHFSSQTETWLFKVLSTAQPSGSLPAALVLFSLFFLCVWVFLHHINVVPGGLKVSDPGVNGWL